MPEVFPLIGGYEVLVGDRLLFFSRRFAARFRGFQIKKASGTLFSERLLCPKKRFAKAFLG